MRLAPAVTVLLAAGLTITFVTHERPPTIAHLAAGAIAAISAIVLLIITLRAPISARGARRVLAVQLASSVACLATLLAQRTTVPLAPWLAMLILLGAPILLTSWWLRWFQKGEAGKSSPSMVLSAATVSLGFLFTLVINVATVNGVVSQASAWQMRSADANFSITPASGWRGPTATRSVTAQGPWLP